MNIIESPGGRSARGKELSMSRNKPRASLYGDGTVMRRMQELVDTLAWVRIELAAGASQKPAGGITHQERALAKMDTALELAKQLVFELDAEVRAQRDSGALPAD
ncbi:MAG TPA: hypothetical protein VGK44_13265 [Casimicrobiaceae bacterium]|jgi:hypothetical protein